MRTAVKWTFNMMLFPFFVVGFIARLVAMGARAGYEVAYRAVEWSSKE